MARPTSSAPSELTADLVELLTLGSQHFNYRWRAARRAKSTKSTKSTKSDRNHQQRHKGGSPDTSVGYTHEPLHPPVHILDRVDVPAAADHLGIAQDRERCGEPVGFQQLTMPGPTGSQVVGTWLVVRASTIGLSERQLLRTTAGLDIIEIQMVAHVLTGCVGRWLEVPGRVPTLAERMVDNPSISLAIEHVDQYLRHVPPVFCFGSETRDIGQVLDRVNDIVQLMRINAQVIQLVTVGLAVDVFEFASAEHEDRGHRALA